jgi:RNA-directed DNA polymerase
VRYADDCNVYVRSERAGHRVMEGLSRFITKKLKLKVNGAKSAVDRPWRRKFLGFSFTAGGGKRRIAPQALGRFKERVRSLTQRTCGRSLETVVADLSRYLRGWLGYFRYCQTPSVLKNLAYWLRRRLRAIACHQWGRGQSCYIALRRHGLSRRQARPVAGSGLGDWRRAWTPAMHMALSEAYFGSLGLPRLAPS